ncbi:GNAT family N-acetyltransferase [Paenibacillus sp. MMS20-IR301]|uniref:GNAT family N-acetyltransferase n=1 Tax=Paenibacillus sp. MMS20-IR301 TaxID=2895946 RepID=UPI0028E8287E|nr:GNAT family N-acetyltransferase [Paenibacillus sp. MMS20-IR301]WNS41451.1 GNAT family N-acetyltransferase [Paenibacillus sp. MMS20-IR301]
MREIPEFEFIKDYKHNEVLRQSFFSLAADTFELQLERWYEEGFWNERYIPYSYAEGNRVIANVSVNLLELIIDGVKCTAVQLGTVMTHPDYRGRGLSARLMDKVLEDYGDQAEFMYLFANDTVLDFYPRFGFRPVEEQLFSMDCPAGTAGSAGSAEIRKLDLSISGDLNLISALAAQRLPVSERLSVSGAQGLLMFYCLNVFSNNLYYLEDEELLAICQQENGQLEIFDLISTKPLSIRETAFKLADSSTETIVFHFTPDDDSDGPQLSSSSSYSGGLFVRNLGSRQYPPDVKHPATSIA